MLSGGLLISRMAWIQPEMANWAFRFHGHPNHTNPPGRLCDLSFASEKWPRRFTHPEFQDPELQVTAGIDRTHLN